jgi:hypothetical protein
LRLPLENALKSWRQIWTERAQDAPETYWSKIKAIGLCHTGPMIRGPMTLAKIGQSDMGLS